MGGGWLPPALTVGLQICSSFSGKSAWRTAAPRAGAHAWGLLLPLANPSSFQAALAPEVLSCALSASCKLLCYTPCVSVIAQVLNYKTSCILGCIQGRRHGRRVEVGDAPTLLS